jgi:hypothetical protein
LTRRTDITRRNKNAGTTNPPGLFSGETKAKNGGHNISEYSKDLHRERDLCREEALNDEEHRNDAEIGKKEQSRCTYLQKATLSSSS